MKIAKLKVTEKFLWNTKRRRQKDITTIDYLRCIFEVSHTAKYELSIN